MFFEPSSKSQMNCEKYQDCSWFQEEPNMDFTSKSSPAELTLPCFESDDIDFDMQFANRDNPPWGEEYLGIFDDEDDVKKWDDKIIGENKKIFNNNPSNDISYSYNNYKAGDDSVNDTYNVHNYIIKKTDSFDSMKNISITNPAEVVPISYREKLNNSQYGLSTFDEVKSEVKEEEVELYSPAGSNTYMIESDDSDLNIGREEIIEVDERIENIEDISKKLPNNIWSDEKENIMKEPRKMEKAAPVLSQVTTHKPNDNKPLVACNENLIPTVLKNGLSLDLAKATFDQSPVIPTPELEFMDLVNYITNDTPTEEVHPPMEHCLPQPSSAAAAIQLPIAAPEPEPEKQKDVRNTYLAIPRQVTSNSREEKLPKMVILKTAATEKSISELTTINFGDIPDTTVSLSIAERIKTSAKRRRSTKYSISELTGSDEEDRDDGDEDYDAVSDELNWRKYTFPKKRSRSSTISSESSCTSFKRIKEEPYFGNDRYRELRDKNNEASRRSRQSRKEKERDMFRSLEDAERKNVRLKARAEELEKLVVSLRQLLLQVVVKKGGAA